MQGELFPSAKPPADVAKASVMVLDARVPRLAISLTQPWATLVARQQKLVETRSWATSFRGPIAIHAAKGFPRECQALVAEKVFQGALGLATPDPKLLPRGVIVAIAELTRCWRFPFERDETSIFGTIAHAEHEIDFGDYTAGRYGFALAKIVPLVNPVAAKGALSLWAIDDETRAQIATQLPVAR